MRIDGEGVYLPGTTHLERLNDARGLGFFFCLGQRQPASTRDTSARDGESRELSAERSDPNPESEG